MSLAFFGVSIFSDTRFIATQQTKLITKLLLDGLAESNKLNIGFLKMLGGGSGPKKITRGWFAVYRFLCRQIDTFSQMDNPPSDEGRSQTPNRLSPGDRSSTARHKGIVSLDFK
jgi:hypothetical protein